MFRIPQDFFPSTSSAPFLLDTLQNISNANLVFVSLSPIWDSFVMLYFGSKGNCDHWRTYPPFPTDIVSCKVIFSWFVWALPAWEWERLFVIINSQLKLSWTNSFYMGSSLFMALGWFTLLNSFIILYLMMGIYVL